MIFPNNLAIGEKKDKQAYIELLWTFVMLTCAISTLFIVRLQLGCCGHL